MKRTPALLLLILSAPAAGGMPMVSLTELASQRIDALSFFVMVLLLSALGLHQLWNRATDWPRLSYGRALGMTVLWGLLFHLVLTMISGARELMTPGAWEKSGATYRLSGSGSLPSEQERREDLETLHLFLEAYSEEFVRLPLSDFDPGVASEVWSSAHPSGARYVYIPGRQLDPDHARILAYEPEEFGSERMVLYTDGRISLRKHHMILRGLRQ